LSFATLCARLFDTQIRRRGDEYFSSGRVGPPLGSENGTSVCFLVRGSQDYKVQFDWGGAKGPQNIRFHCNCPYFAGGDNCKHLWAAILQVDSQLDFSQLTSLERLSRPDSLPTQDTTPFWKRRLETIQGYDHAELRKRQSSRGNAKKTRSAYFSFDLLATRQSGQFTIQFHTREKTKTGELGDLKLHPVSKDSVSGYHDPIDQEILSLLLATGIENKPYYYYDTRTAKSLKAVITPSVYGVVFPKICDAGKLFYKPIPETIPSATVQTLAWDRGAAWKFELRIANDGTHFHVKGFFLRDTETREVDSALVILSDGLIVFPDCVALRDSTENFGWLVSLRDGEGIVFPQAEADDWVSAFYQAHKQPSIIWPDELRWEHVAGIAKPQVSMISAPTGANTFAVLLRLSFKYEDLLIGSLSPEGSVIDRAHRRIIERNPMQEADFLRRLESLGLAVAPARLNHDFNFKVRSRDFIRIAKEIISWGWDVEAEGKPIQSVQDFSVSLSSGVDWLDLKGTAIYPNGSSIELPALLAALRRGDSMVALDDGSVGMLPEEWLSKYSVLATFGSDTENSVRFRKSQAILLDSWLENDTSVKVDLNFKKLRNHLNALDTPTKDEAPAEFKGTLRTYQKQGLQWLRVLNECEIGGILADDMGLGKTVQVLAHLERQRTHFVRRPKEKLPSLVVVPKSLVFNWIDEAKRFVPSLKLMNYTGPERKLLIAELPHADLILTTYATLRLDMEYLKTLAFNYIILDEAQAIKNRKAQTSVACKQLHSLHRLIMTGTPIENSLDDLFSLMDFINPGLLGNSTVDRMSRVIEGGQINQATIEPLSRALRPFILRRTKSQVLKDLPAKTEKILHCELNPIEREQYNELKLYFQTYLNQKIRDVGMGRAKFVVLEALLRLRQAACHPGLIDSKKKKASSTKLDILVEQIKEVIEGGHKALVFSQFTTFLGIIATRFKAEKISYEYLDGKTRDRKDRVNHFQNNDRVQTFLISLKAGGVGLNLTAADYVFILDPWWNPAAESQAIDRTHRIGQTKKITAYRLIAKDTVEEKILELQNTKRELAESVINADSSLFKKLTLDDVRWLIE